MRGSQPALSPDTPFREEFSVTKLLLRQPDASWLVTSPFWSETIQLALRVVLASLCLSMYIACGHHQNSSTWLIYSTNWVFFTVTTSSVGFLILSVSHIYYEQMGRERGTEQGDAVRLVWRWYHSLLQILFTLALSGSLVVSVSVYCLMGRTVDSLGIILHGLNSIATLAELLTSNFKVNLAHGIYPTLVGAGYFAMSSLYTPHSTHVSVYFLLDWYKDPRGVAALVDPVWLLVPLLVHLLAYGLCKIRMKLARPCTCFPCRQLADSLHIKNHDGV